MADFTGEEITALADTIDTAANDERDYILGSGGANDYDGEWPEVAEAKATRWNIIANAMQKMGQTYTADVCNQLAADIRATLDTCERCNSATTTPGCCACDPNYTGV